MVLVLHCPTCSCTQPDYTRTHQVHGVRGSHTCALAMYASTAPVAICRSLSRSSAARSYALTARPLCSPSSAVSPSSCAAERQAVKERMCAQ